MGNRGCNRCKNYKRHELNINGNGTPRKCLIGNDEGLLLWWEENGPKKEGFSDMDCFEETESAKHLNEMNRLLDEMIRIIK